MFFIKKSTLTRNLKIGLPTIYLRVVFFGYTSNKFTSIDKSPLISVLELDFPQYYLPFSAYTKIYITRMNVSLLGH